MSLLAVHHSRILSLLSVKLNASSSICTLKQKTNPQKRGLSERFNLPTHTCSANVGEWMQVKSRRPSCSTRRLMVSSTTSTLFNWRSFTGSRVAMPLGLASANRSSSWVAVEMAWPGGSSLWDERVKGTMQYIYLNKYMHIFLYIYIYIHIVVGKMFQIGCFHNIYT